MIRDAEAVFSAVAASHVPSQLEPNVFMTVRNNLLYIASGSTDKVSTIRQARVQTDSNRSETDSGVLLLPNLSLMSISAALWGRLGGQSWSDFEKFSPVYHLDYRVIEHEGFRALDFGSDSNVKIVGGDKRVFAVDRLVNGSAEPIVVLESGLFVRSEVQKFWTLTGRLAAENFSKNKTKVLSLVRNTDTEDALSHSRNLGTRLIKFESGDGPAQDSLTRFRDLLRREVERDPDGRIVVLGHLDGSEIVSRNAAKEVLFRLSTKDLRSVRDATRGRIIFLGCNSAKEEGAITGVMGEFNSVDAVERLDDAMNASNMLDFFRRLCCAKSIGKVVLPIVVAETDAPEARETPAAEVVGSVHQRTADGRRVAKARIGIVRGIVVGPPPEPEESDLEFFLFAVVSGLMFGTLLIWLSRRG